MASNGKQLPRMMLGFVVRQCATAVGHMPTPEEFATWANNYSDGGRTFYLFGRPISIREAHVILRHPGREVSTRSIAPTPQLSADDLISPTVVNFAAAVARLRRKQIKS